MNNSTSISKGSLLFIPPFLLAFALGLLTVTGGFVLDDIRIVAENELLHSLKNIPSFFTQNYWGHEARGGLFRPLTLASFALESAIWGQKEAFGYHITNTLFYALCSGLISLTTFQMGASFWAAMAGGLLFAAHPIHVEPVAGIVGRSELGACLFILLAFWQVTRQKKSTWFTAMIISISFLAAVFFKETGLALVPTLLLFSVCLSTSDGSRESSSPSISVHIQLIVIALQKQWRTWSLLFICTLLWFILRSNALTGSMEISFLNNPLITRTAIGRIAGALEVFLLYVKMSFIPWPLSADYSYAALVPAESLLSLKPLLGLLLLVALTVSCLLFIKKSPLTTTGLGLFLFSIIPISNILLPIGTIFGERLLFIPTAGLAWVVSDLLTALFKTKRHILMAILPITLLGCIGFTIRIPDWKDELSITRSTYQAHPKSSKINEKLGWELIRLAETNSHKKSTLYSQGERHLKEALAIYPENGIAHLNLGVLYQRTGRFKEAITEALEFNRINKNHWLYFNLLSSSFFALKEYDKALSVLNEGLALYPEKNEWRIRRGALRKALQISSKNQN